MPRTRPAYPPEFRDQIVALARTGRSVEDLALEFEPCSHTIRSWLRSAGVGEGRHAVLVDPLSSEERDELRRLRKEVRQLRQERDILSKGEPRLAATGPRPVANAWFATNDATSPGSTRS